MTHCDRFWRRKVSGGTVVGWNVIGVSPQFAGSSGHNFANWWSTSWEAYIRSPFLILGQLWHTYYLLQFYPSFSTTAQMPFSCLLPSTERGGQNLLLFSYRWFELLLWPPFPYRYTDYRLYQLLYLLDLWIYFCSQWGFLSRNQVL